MELGQVHKASPAPQSKLCTSKQPHKIALLYNFLLIYLSTIKVGSDQIKYMPCIIAAIIVLGCILHSMHLSYQCYTPCVGQFEDLAKLSIGAVGCHCQSLKMIYIAKTLYFWLINLWLISQGPCLGCGRKIPISLCWTIVAWWLIVNSLVSRPHPAHARKRSRVSQVQILGVISETWSDQ